MAVSTVNRDLATLRKLLRFAVNEGVIQKAYAITLQGGEATRERVISADEERVYLSAASPLLYGIAIVMLDCELRPDEVHRLRWDVNIKPGEIEVHTGKTDGARRTIPTTERVDALLASLPRSGPFVFPAPTKAGHINADSYKKHHAKATKTLASFVPYSLRHTCITRWAKADASPATLMYLAGHKNLATTMKYIHLAGTDAGAELAEIRKRMARVVTISTTPDKSEAA
jgi:integrase